ncbi:SDR family NAD(P)-dependent oxidoreductase [Hymenobacter sp. BT491]|uniref:SDR family NAD(P)-dependent oxidoreductase n=1 Tax=Hymenobacter sp. BT491 TaxID=2766779 RepID=UPI0016534727|nr:glucose 1-dehydrogenase [Hymenobacter sp. BT491]MBC6990556.1 SDR family oxidoreductase [Hymenobacter sp. BT491]
MQQFENQVVIITGASSGIGKAAAVAFAQAGAHVVVADVIEEAGQALAQQLSASGPRSLFVACDVASPASVQRLVQQTLSTFGRLDVAINNAGVGGASALSADYPDEEWQRVIGINLSGVWYCQKYELQAMVAAGRGVIINMASILGKVGFAGASAYVAAKHGLIGLTETAALEYGPQGIRINAVCPGFIETPMLTKAGIEDNQQLHDQIAAKHALQRMGKPEEITGALLWLASDQASFVTGQAIVVDGGYLAQ